MHDLTTFFFKHWELVILFILLIIAVVMMEIQSGASGGKKITPRKAVEAMNEQDAMVVDVRPFDIFKKGHIKDAVNLPVAMLEQHIKKIEKHKSKPLIVCGVGSDAQKAGEKLKKLGFENVFVLSGGLSAWQNDDLPTVKGA